MHQQVSKDCVYTVQVGTYHAVDALSGTKIVQYDIESREAPLSVTRHIKLYGKWMEQFKRLCCDI